MYMYTTGWTIIHVRMGQVNQTWWYNILRPMVTHHIFCGSIGKYSVSHYVLSSNLKKINVHIHSNTKCDRILWLYTVYNMYNIIVYVYVILTWGFFSELMTNIISPIGLPCNFVLDNFKGLDGNTHILEGCCYEIFCPRSL